MKFANSQIRKFANSQFAKNRELKNLKKTPLIRAWKTAYLEYLDRTSTRPGRVMWIHMLLNPDREIAKISFQRPSYQNFWRPKGKRNSFDQKCSRGTFLTKNVPLGKRNIFGLRNFLITRPLERDIREFALWIYQIPVTFQSHSSTLQSIPGCMDLNIYEEGDSVVGT